MQLSIKYSEGMDDYYLCAESAGKVQFRVSFVGLTLMLCRLSEVFQRLVCDKKRLSNNACVKQSKDCHRRQMMARPD